MHYLISGKSGFGKTTLATSLSAMYRKQGYGVIVFDPMNDTRWSADFKTSDFLEFVAVYETSRNCRVFIDECKLLDEPEYKKAFRRMPAIGRHYGHVHYYIGQRATAVPPDVRFLCTGVFAFRQAHEDATELAKTFAHDGLRDVKTLKRGEYLFCDGETIYKGKAL